MRTTQQQKKTFKRNVRPRKKEPNQKRTSHSFRFHSHRPDGEMMMMMMKMMMMVVVVVVVTADHRAATLDS